MELMRIIKPAAAALLGICATAAWAENGFTFSSYGTLGVVRTNNDSLEFRSSARQDQGADRSGDFGVDTRLGAQATYQLNDQFSAVGQLLASRRDGKQGVQVEWLYGQFSPVKTVDLRVGRLVLPIFMLSDNRNVGYAHYWMRAPQEVYGAYPLTSFDGVQARWRDSVQNVNFNVQASAGRSKANLYFDSFVPYPALVGGPFAVPNAKVRLEYPQLYSLAVSAEKGFWTVRASKTYGKKTEMTSQDTKAFQERFLGSLPPGVASLLPPASNVWLDKGTDNFTNIGMQYDDGSIVVMGEFVARRYSFEGKLNSNSYYLSGGYRLGAFTPYATFSHFTPKGDYLTQSSKTPGITRAVGLRWDAASNVALKAQVERVRRTDVVFTNGSLSTLTNPPSVTAVSLALDFVF